MKVKWMFPEPHNWGSSPEVFTPGVDPAGVADPNKRVGKTKNYIRLGDTDEGLLQTHS